MDRSYRGLIVLTVISGLGMLAAAVLALIVAPRAAGLTPTETDAQRIIYFHVPCAWVSLLAFGVTMVASIGYLATGRRRWDSLAVSSAEIGIAFTLAAIASGSIWAKGAWNTWWTWDPRLTSVTFMLLLYIAYFMLRGAIEEPARRARFSAVYGIFAFASVPITYFSIKWWKTIHPKLSLSPRMLLIFILCALAFTLFYVALLLYRLRLEETKEHVEELKDLLGY